MFYAIGRKLSFLAGTLLIALNVSNTFGQALPSATPNVVADLYVQSCSGCHGRNLDGGKSKSLLGTLTHGADDESMSRSIRLGFPNTGMPGFKLLSDAEVRSLVIYIRELRAESEGFRRNSRTHDLGITLPEGDVSSEVESFRVEKVVGGILTPYSFAFLPDGRILVTEKYAGQLRIIENGKLSEPIKGVPHTYIFHDGNASLMGVEVHPDYAHNAWIYLSFGEPAGEDRTKSTDKESPTMTTIVRGRIRDGAWVDQQTIWQCSPELRVRSNGDFFGRMAFGGDGYLYFSIGVDDIGKLTDRMQAQDLSQVSGKIHRIRDDGRIPKDNPFVNRPGAVPSIWSYGHRNPQGLAFDFHTRRWWSSEHGPRGGDELNLIKRGRNYGWPVITYGMNYDGTPITSLTAKEEMEQPVVNWTPSIAVSSIAFYEGNKFLKWNHNLFVTSLKMEELFRFVIDGKKVLHQELILKDIGRLRDIKVGPDGFIYLLVEIRSTTNPQASYIVRLVPTK